MPYLTRRVAAAVLVIFGAITLVFLVLYWLPGDPATLVAGENASAETVDHVRARLGTDRPLWQQYGSYISGLAHGDLGVSFATNEPVLGRLLAQVPATMQLTLLSCLFAIMTGVVLGIASAVSRGGWVDQTIQAFTLFLTSMPAFWIGILLIMIFSVSLHWLPAIGSGTAKQLVLPVACLGLAASGKLARMVRDSVLDVLDEPFVTTLRAKGLRERQVLFGHVLRNAMIPVITLLGILVGELMSGAVVTETVFARQGVGRILVEALGVKDIPVVQGVILLASVFYVLVNLLVDLSYSWIDRRIQLEA